MTDALRIATGKNETAGIQILAGTETGVTVSVEEDLIDVKFYQMVDVPVEFNHGNGVEQGGAMSILVDTCPDYAIRKAPFRVYDCMKPMTDGCISAVNGVAAAYITVHPKAETAPGTYEILIHITCDGETHICRLTYVIYDITFDDSRFLQVNWLNYGQIDKKHDVMRGTPEFTEVLRAYARTLRAMHQNVFCIDLGYAAKNAQPPYHFDFEALTPMAEVFFEEGFQYFSTGDLLVRGYKPDGSQDMYSNDLKCAANPKVSMDSIEGFDLISSEMRDLAAYLKRHGWEKKLILSVFDEPDVRVLSDEDLQARRVQYMTASNIARRYLPGVKILKPVQGVQFRGGVDVMCPIISSFERNKEVFQKAMELGNELWTYVCCGPQGYWLNRFLDCAVNHSRLLFWGCAKNGISGFLHWGGNFFDSDAMPFEKTSCYNSTGLGTNFPCGDAFIIYPGPKEPWISHRYEAQRRGHADACLLSMLKEKDPEAHDALISRVFTTFKEYNDDPELIEQVHEELLQMLTC